VRTLGLAQRILLVVALAIALGVLGRYLISLGHPSNFGWFAYAPLNSTSTIRPPGLHPWARLLIWVGLIAVWALASLMLLRPTRQGEPNRL
jgi:ABC-type branched-subunit amino acid transport system permease subunit